MDLDADINKGGRLDFREAICPKFQNRKLVGHQKSTSIWGHIIHWKNS